MTYPAFYPSPTSYPSGPWSPDPDPDIEVPTEFASPVSRPDFILKAREILSDLPPYYDADPLTLSIVAAAAKELQRIEDFILTIREQMHPAQADDEYHLLGLWEARVGLPVEPEGVSVAARRQLVEVAVRRRSEGAGESWYDLITTILGTTNWTHEEQRAGEYRLAIDIPLVDDYTEAQLVAFVGQICPAHLQVDLAIDGVNFQVGVNAVGDTI